VGVHLRITRIIVKNLFGMFDHDIPLFQNGRITIIHSPNGYGKTTIFRLLRAITRCDRPTISRTPFESFRIDFDDGASIVVTKHAANAWRTTGPDEEEDFVQLEKIAYEFSMNGSSEPEFELKEIDRQFLSLVRSGVEKYLPSYLEPVSQTAWFDMRHNVRVEWDEIVELLAQERTLPAELIQTIEKPAWLKNHLDPSKVDFVTSQRLLTRAQTTSYRLSADEPRRNIGRSDNQGYRQSVTVFSGILKDMIRDEQARFGAKAQELDRNFPADLISALGGHDPGLPIDDAEKIVKDLKSLEEERRELDAEGLFEKSKASVLPALDETAKKDKVLLLTLALVVKNERKKLEVLEELKNRITTLKNVVNSQFSYKSMEVDPGKGIRFRTPDNKTLPPRKLSSGEQHMLVMNYRLLFEATPGSLILIDEPEISLHVAWQQQYIKNLLDIAEKSDLDIIVATHSPDIVYDRWDLTIELKGASVVSAKA
jgi:ABC-type lipoprotein export system ATPase subunit